MPAIADCGDVPDPGPVDWCKLLNILDHKIQCQTVALQGSGDCDITSVAIDGIRVEAGSPQGLLDRMVSMRTTYYKNCEMQQAADARGTRCATIAVPRGPRSAASGRCC